MTAPLRTLARDVAIACGLLAPVVWAGVIIFAGTLRPEFSHVTQYISELGERTSTTELLMRYGAFVPTGLMHVTFAAYLFVAFRKQPLAAAAAMLLAINGVARIAAGMFPCEVGCTVPRVLLSEKLHHLAAGIGFFSFIGAVVVWGIFFRRVQGLRSLSAYSLTTGCLGLLFLAFMTGGGPAGLYERLSSGVLSFWVFVFAAKLWPLRVT
jgi:hypothetical membrane protein